MVGTSKFRNLVSTKIENTPPSIFKMEGINGGQNKWRALFYLATIYSKSILAYNTWQKNI